MEKFDFGLIGLGVMGRNFILNIAGHGHSALGYDLEEDQVDALNKEAREYKVKGVGSLDEFVSGLARPRKVMMLVPAGVVDNVIDDLVPKLEKGDLIIDGGNSHPDDTDRRAKDLTGKGFRYIGVGVSGGAEGARHGPSMMPGGDEDAYQEVKEIFEGAAAHVEGEPCVTLLGPGSAGHFVKMVHNGIEYGIMQLISEVYDIMKNGLKMTNLEMKGQFETWNDGPLSSFLVEITADILGKEDEVEDGYLIDHILDSAKQKGTGKWTSQIAMDMQVPVPTVDTAVSMRHLSAFKDEREKAGMILNGPEPKIDEDKTLFLKKLENALYMSMMLSYAQGMELLRIASQEKNYGFDLSEVARIWRGGCIIRSKMLWDFMEAFRKDPGLPNLLFADKLARSAALNEKDLRAVVIKATDTGIPVPGFMSVLSYFDAYRSGHLAANMIQAQRDYFGSHTYQRVDEKGVFHTDW